MPRNSSRPNILRSTSRHSLHGETLYYTEKSDGNFDFKQVSLCANNIISYSIVAIPKQPKAVRTRKSGLYYRV